ncbi:MAG: DNA/RNA nuclease SfsA [Fusobacteria bacterium]|nr:DNA/RNA nuclease SfsA [Fusobacteriota bacterium]
MIPVFQFDNLLKGYFISRVNRYVVELKLECRTVVMAHLHDPGRLKELLYSDNLLLILPVESDTRKTKFDIIAAKKEAVWVLIHSGYHRKIAESFFKFDELLPFSYIKSIRPEVKVGQSRLDFQFSTLERDIFVEQKGCSLEINGIAKFPDAPTIRGTKHLRELISLVRQGYDSAIFMFVYLPAKLFEPNMNTDPKFCTALTEALEVGVKLHVFQFILIYYENTANAILYFQNKLPYSLNFSS